MSTTNEKRATANSPCESACPTCNGQLFLDVAPNGGLELLCTGCFLYELTPVERPAPAIQDLPSALVFFRPAEREVFRIVRDCADAGGLMPRAIVSALELRTDEFASRYTVSHSLTKLQRAGFVQRGNRGWVTCERKGGAQ